MIDLIVVLAIFVLIGSILDGIEDLRKGGYWRE